MFTFSLARVPERAPDIVVVKLLRSFPLITMLAMVIVKLLRVRLSLLAVFTSVIAGVYYLNIIKEVFFYLPDEWFRESLVRVKLPNFREPLKLLVPSDNRKIISG